MIPTILHMDALQWEVGVGELGHEQTGECRGEDCQIVLAGRLTEQMQEQTLWHEVIHMMMRCRDLDAGKKYTEEEFATHMGPALFTFMRTNCEIKWKPECFADNIGVQDD